MRVIVEEKDGILAGLSDTDRDLWHEVIEFTHTEKGTRLWPEFKSSPADSLCSTKSYPISSTLNHNIKHLKLWKIFDHSKLCYKYILNDLTHVAHIYKDEKKSQQKLLSWMTKNSLTLLVDSCEHSRVSCSVCPAGGYSHTNTRQEAYNSHR